MSQRNRPAPVNQEHTAINVMRLAILIKKYNPCVKDVVPCQLAQRIGVPRKEFTIRIAKLGFFQCVVQTENYFTGRNRSTVKEGLLRPDNIHLTESGNHKLISSICKFLAI